MADVTEQKLGTEVYDIKAKSVVDQNTANTDKLRFWTGTQAQYDAITTHDSKTQYTVTDTKKLYLGDVEIVGGGSGGVDFLTVVDGEVNIIYEE